MSLSLRGKEVPRAKAQLVERSSEPGGAHLVNPYRTTKHAPSDLVELAQEIQKADAFTRATVSNKLQVIAEQVRFLQEQARRVLQEAQHNADLHHAACNFVKQPGSTYHLYGRPSGQRYFSMISPQEWGGDCPHEHLGTYRLEADQSWTAVEDLDNKDADQQLIDKILTCTNVAASITG
ncbi:Protein of unknown function DUF2452 [Trinorchestia longiramus]|nr:Protein of unknown function DUF2452 [Trinorchestia longiramus]